MDIAQSRCVWWIEGMLRLVKAIEDAPEPLTRGAGVTRAQRAHRAVRTALSEGVLRPQSCEVCGTSQPIHAHHDDYSAPVDVRWLCQEHHIAHHKAMGTYRNNGTGPRRRMRRAS
jgi:hypothetical protein